jgi:hypothetical protein
MTIHGPYAALDHVFLVEVPNGPDPELDVLFEAMAAPGATATRRYVLTLPEGDQKGSLEGTSDGERVEKAEVGSLHELLLFAVQTEAVEALEDPVVHGCLVEHRGRGVLVAGLSGRGKSTLTARLLTEGAALVTEDLTALGADGIRPYPRPVALSAASLEVLGIPVPEDDCGCGCMKHVMAPDALGGAIGAPRPIDVLVLCDATTADCTELSLPEAMAHLFDQASLGNVEDTAALSRLAGLLAGARCVALGTADLAAAVATLDRLLATLAPAAPVEAIAAERLGEGSVLYLDGEALIHLGDRVHHLDPVATGIWVLHTEGLSDEEVAAELAAPLDLVASTLERLRELELPAPTA